MNRVLATSEWYENDFFPFKMDKRTNLVTIPFSKLNKQQIE